MDLALKIIVSLIAGLFLFMGATLMFVPVSGVEGFSVTPLGADGLNTVRGDLGGMFLASALLLLLGLLQRRPAWLLAVALLMALIAAGRIVGFLLDGSPGSQPVQAFVAELIIAGVLVLTARRFAASSP